ncbi:hypothetical protein POVCU1_001540 [Plasmodium ovale curtisi]|uniref:Uncharacterized protein n=1 Tax=Plasmodium ovale curtisi TaxID=864141 RepID=A0A1A8VP42_PLAOA|nr:hypothetical protein POVCU1_001540 [Plasmodium ovale curtisi]
MRENVTRKTRWKEEQEEEKETKFELTNLIYNFAHAYADLSFFGIFREKGRKHRTEVMLLRTCQYRDCVVVSPPLREYLKKYYTPILCSLVGNFNY